MKPGSPKLVGYSGFPVEEPFFFTFLKDKIQVTLIHFLSHMNMR